MMLPPTFLRLRLRVRLLCALRGTEVVVDAARSRVLVSIY
jgi:hypothetical protein